MAEDEEKLQKLYDIQELDDDIEEFEYALSQNGIETQEDLEKNINLLRNRIEKTKQKILAANAEELIDEPPTKQLKLNKIVFENEKALQLYVQNAKRMVNIKSNIVKHLCDYFFVLLQKQEILNKKLVRKQRKQDMAKRRTAAGQERMRIISQLARKEKGNDDFGIRDEDWDIYKTISRDGKT